MNEYNQILSQIKNAYDNTTEKFISAKANLEQIKKEIKTLTSEIPSLEFELDILSNPRKVGTTIAKKHHFGRKILLVGGIYLLSIGAFFLLSILLSQPGVLLKLIGLIGTGSLVFLIISEAIGLAKLSKQMSTDYLLALAVLKNENMDDVKKELQLKNKRKQELEKQKINTEELIAILPNDLEQYAQSYNTIALKMANEPTMITYSKENNTTIFQDMRNKRVLKKVDKES